mgnify:CR=1 FL=1
MTLESFDAKKKLNIIKELKGMLGVGLKDVKSIFFIRYSESFKF